MDNQQKYKITQKAKNVAETSWIALPGDNKTSRKLMKLDFIREFENPDKVRGIHLEVMYQNRNSEKVPWPSETVDLRTIKRGFGLKLPFDSAQTKRILDGLNDAYPICSDNITSGERVVLRGIDENEVIVTESNKITLLKQLTEALSQQDINNWLQGNLSFISSNVALAKVYRDRNAEIEEFNQNIGTDKDENYWKAFLKRNKWMFGSAYINIVEEDRIDIHHETDLPFEVEGGFMDIVEIKRPNFPFWARDGQGNNYLYRDKFLIPHREIQGATSQLSKYILQAEKNVDSTDYINAHGGIIPMKPKGLVVHGRSVDWEESEWEAFRLLNDNLHNIQIITFDVLLERAKNVLKIMEVEETIDTGVEPVTGEVPF